MFLYVGFYYSCENSSNSTAFRMRSLSFPLVEMNEDMELDEIDSTQNTGKRDCQEVSGSQHADQTCDKAFTRDSNKLRNGVEYLAALNIAGIVATKSGQK